MMSRVVEESKHLLIHDTTSPDYTDVRGVSEESQELSRAFLTPQNEEEDIRLAFSQEHGNRVPRLVALSIVECEKSRAFEQAFKRPDHFFFLQCFN